MTKTNKYTECMTLRLEPHVDEMVTNASYEARTTKSDWVRVAIRRSLQDKQPKKMTWAEPVLR